MQSIRQKLILLSVIILGTGFATETSAQFWEIQDPALPYIAMVRGDPQWGSTVVYNPVMCEQIGDACAFFRAHEYGHAFMNDVLMAAPHYYAPSLENKADCWAAKYIKPHEALAAYQLLSEPDKYPQVPIYGNPAERAELVRECAKEKGYWPE